MNEYDIAIVGMALKFPGANTLEEYWDLISNGRETITFFSDDELKKNGVSPNKLQDKNYVKAAPILDDIAMFDDKFFNYSPSEVIAMDPQHRLWLECCWNAIENAGYAVDKYNGSIGVFGSAGGNISSYFLEYLRENPDIVGETGSFPQLGNDKDFLATRVSYKLNLKGPSMTVQSACSSSLVSVHLACQSLLNGECDMVLAGGSTVRVPHYSGYRRQEGGILSSDGHCRAFDENADGVIFGSGIGVVLLKPALKAFEDKDHIYAIIKGTAINNDGGQKISYTASSTEGQIRAATEAIELSGFNPQEIGYLEAHGTGTNLGDPIEVSALSQAFRKYTEKKQFCAIGSVKSNIGHCEASAGIAGLIKAALCLYHRKIPPVVNYKAPNPKINFEESPFYVPKTLRNWHSQVPRKAALNSLGMGGTNAFALLEEALPSFEILTNNQNKFFGILTISAKTNEALNDYIARFISFLKHNETDHFSDICYTSNTGRSHFSKRLAIIAESTKDCYEKLEAYAQGHTLEGVYDGSEQVFQTNGQNVVFKINSQKVNDKRYLESLCRAYVAGEAIDWFALENNEKRKKVVLPTYPFQRKRFWVGNNLSSSNQLGTIPKVLDVAMIDRRWDTAIGTLLITELSTQKYPYLIDHKINNKIVVPIAAHVEMGLSAAKLVFGKGPLLLKDIIVQRELTLDEDTNRHCQIHLKPSLEGEGTYELKIFGYDQQETSDSGTWTLYSSMIVSKPNSEVPRIANDFLTAASIPAKIKDIVMHYNAFSKAGLNFGPAFRGIGALQKKNEYIFGDIKAPTDIEVSTQNYLIHPVILDNCLQVLGALFTHEEQERDLYLPFNIDSLVLHDHAKDDGSKLRSIGKIRESNIKNPNLYIADVMIFDESNNLIAEVNGICFKRIDKVEFVQKDKEFDLTYRIEWEQQAEIDDSLRHPTGLCVIFSNKSNLSEKLKKLMKFKGIATEIIYHDFNQEKPDTDLEKLYANLADAESLNSALYKISAKYQSPVSEIVFAWDWDCSNVDALVTEIEESQKVLCGGLLAIAQTMIKDQSLSSAGLSIIVPETFRVTDNQKVLSFMSSSIIGLVNVLNLEHPELSCKVIDTDQDTTLNNLLKEILLKDRTSQVAYRNNIRYLAKLAKTEIIVPNTLCNLSQESTYVVTGGTGGLGEVVVEWLIKHGAKNIILLSRSDIHKKEGHPWIEQWRKEGFRIDLMKADISDYAQTFTAFEKIKEAYPPIKGIIHMAGALDDGTIVQQTWNRFWKVMAPKVQGSYNLHIISKELNLDFFVLFSSAAGMLGTLGQANYAAANSFLDGLMRYRRLNNMPALSICWGPWNLGMAANLSEQDSSRLKTQGFDKLKRSQGLKILDRLILSQFESEIGVFSIDWQQYKKQFNERTIPFLMKNLTNGVKLSPQPDAENLNNTNMPVKIINPHSQEDVKDILLSEISKVLSIDKDEIGEEEPLIEIGLDSLMAVQLRNDLSKKLNKTLPITMFFDYPSLKQVLNFLSK